MSSAKKKNGNLNVSKLAWSNTAARGGFHNTAAPLFRKSLDVPFDVPCWLVGPGMSDGGFSRRNDSISSSGGGKPEVPESRRMKLIIGQCWPKASANLDLPMPLLWTNSKVFA